MSQIKTTHFLIEVKEGSLVYHYRPVVASAEIDATIKVEGNKLIATAVGHDFDGEDVEIFEISLTPEQAEKLRDAINQIKSVEDLKNFEEAIAETEKEVERKIFERMDDVENEIANTKMDNDTECMQTIRRLDSDEIDEILMRALSEPKGEDSEEPTFEGEIEEVVEDPINVGGIEDILSGKPRDKEDRKDIEAEIAVTLNEIYALITTLDYSTKYVEKLYSLNTDDIIQILMLAVCGCDGNELDCNTEHMETDGIAQIHTPTVRGCDCNKEPKQPQKRHVTISVEVDSEEPYEETVKEEYRFDDINVENATDLEKVGGCMVSKSQRLLFTRMPADDAVDHFSLASEKYKNFEINIEKNKYDGKRWGFVSIEYNQQDDFEKDVETICKGMRNE